MCTRYNVKYHDHTKTAVHVTLPSLNFIINSQQQQRQQQRHGSRLQQALHLAPATATAKVLGALLAAPAVSGCTMHRLLFVAVGCRKKSDG